MMCRQYNKNNVEMHSMGYGGRQYPAVNVKVYDSWQQVDLTSFQVDMGDGFTLEWLEENVEDTVWMSAFESACYDGWETLQEYACEVWQKAQYGKIKVWSVGRSGGWAVVDGLPNVEDWDAVMLAKWRKFERMCEVEAKDIPYRMVDYIAYNVYPYADIA